MGAVYESLSDQEKSARDIIDQFGKDYDGPKNLYLLRLAEICKKIKGTQQQTDWLAIREIILKQKKDCSVLRESFDMIIRDNDSKERIKHDIDVLRQSYKRTKKAEWLSKIPEST